MPDRFTLDALFWCYMYAGESIEGQWELCANNYKGWFILNIALLSALLRFCPRYEPISDLHCQLISSCGFFSMISNLLIEIWGITLSAKRNPDADSGSQRRVVISLARDVTLWTSQGVFCKKVITLVDYLIDVYIKDPINRLLLVHLCYLSLTPLEVHTITDNR